MASGIDSITPTKASWTWKSVEAAKPILLGGACKIVKNGEYLNLGGSMDSKSSQLQTGACYKPMGRTHP